MDKICYVNEVSNFAKISGCPIAYWISNNFSQIFDNPLIYDFSISDGQNVTSDNARFVRCFWELNKNNIGKGRKWRYYAKGGGYRKWYGNIVDVVDWSSEAISFYHKNNKNIFKSTHLVFS